MEHPGEAFCIFNNAFFGPTFSHLTKTEKQRARKNFYNHLADIPSQSCCSPRRKSCAGRGGMGRDVAGAAPGCLGMAVFGGRVSWSSSRVFFLFPVPFQSRSLLLPTEGGCLLYLVPSSARLWLGFVFTPFIVFLFRSRATSPYFFLTDYVQTPSSTGSP